MTNITVPLPNDGYFEARPESVGTTEEEIHLAGMKMIPSERVDQIVRCTGRAMEILKNVEPSGRC